MSILYKFIAGLMLFLMLSFIGVQWNDPDGVLWAAIYGLPASLMLIVLTRPTLLAITAGRIVLGCIVTALLFATISAWPEQDQFWTREVWWEEETAREGMGLMVALLVSAVAIPASIIRPRR